MGRATSGVVYYIPKDPVPTGDFLPLFYLCFYKRVAARKPEVHGKHRKEFRFGLGSRGIKNQHLRRLKKRAKNAKTADTLLSKFLKRF